MAAADKLIESFATMVRAHRVPIREDDNGLRLSAFEKKLPKRLPQSFRSLLSHYSFPAFDVMGVSLFRWDSDTNPYIEEAAAAKGSLSELLLPSGYVQIGRPEGGDFDAICFDLNQQAQNREFRIVQIDHEYILCDRRICVSRELWPSFVKLVDSALSTGDPQVYYEQKLERLIQFPPAESGGNQDG
jgi:hypothetical protein